MDALRLGQRYPGLGAQLPGGTLLPDGAQYQYDRGGHALLVTMRRPSPAEVAAYRAGAPGDVAVLVDGPVVLLCYRLGDGPWSEAPYAWHLVADDRRTLPDASTGSSRALLQCVLLDADGGIVRGLRAASLSPEVTDYLHRAIVAQSQAPWDARAFDARLARLMDATSDELAGRAAVRCRLGA